VRIRNNAGIYGAVTRTGRLAVGQTILFRAAADKTERGFELGDRNRIVETLSRRLCSLS
jgi:hypothetical protein